MQRSAPARESAPLRSDIPFVASLVPASPRDTAPGLAVRASKGFASWLKGALVVLGVMYIVLGFVLSFGVSVVSRVDWGPSGMTNTVERSIAADQMKPFMLTPDPSIAPDEAGLAFQSLQPANQHGGAYRYRDVPDRPAVPWRTWKIDQTLFNGFNRSSWDGPNNTTILAQVKKGFSPKEKELLRVIATAPAWKKYDLFARAASADLVGGRFDLPLSPDATMWAMPVPKFAATKEFAYASVSRAAWHLSEGRKDSAEFALRSTISFGRVMAANSSTPIEQLIGNVITGIGSAGLRELYTITGDPRLATMPVVDTKAGRFAAEVPAEIRELGRGTQAEIRDRLIYIATTPTFSRAVRMTALTNLSISTCTSFTGIVAGPSGSVRAAFDQARRDLGRYPGELALIDVAEDGPSRFGQLDAQSTDETMNAAYILSRIYFNPRLGMCALMSANVPLFNAIK